MIKFKKIRLAKGYTQAGLAAKIKVPLSTLQKWEQEGKGHRNCPEVVFELLKHVKKK